MRFSGPAYQTIINGRNEVITILTLTFLDPTEGDDARFLTVIKEGMGILRSKLTAGLAIAKL